MGSGDKGRAPVSPELDMAVKAMSIAENKEDDLDDGSRLLPRWCGTCHFVVKS